MWEGCQQLGDTVFAHCAAQAAAGLDSCMPGREEAGAPSMLPVSSYVSALPAPSNSGSTSLCGAPAWRLDDGKHLSSLPPISSCSGPVADVLHHFKERLHFVCPARKDPGSFLQARGAWWGQLDCLYCWCWGQVMWGLPIGSATCSPLQPVVTHGRQVAVQHMLAYCCALHLGAGGDDARGPVAVRGC